MSFQSRSSPRSYHDGRGRIILRGATFVVMQKQELHGRHPCQPNLTARGVWRAALLANMHAVWARRNGDVNVKFCAG